MPLCRVPNGTNENIKRALDAGVLMQHVKKVSSPVNCFFLCRSLGHCRTYGRYGALSMPTFLHLLFV